MIKPEDSVGFITYVAKEPLFCDIDRFTLPQATAPSLDYKTLDRARRAYDVTLNPAFLDLSLTADVLIVFDAQICGAIVLRSAFAYNIWTSMVPTSEILKSATESSRSARLEDCQICI